jgi:hypothetical protein
MTDPVLGIREFERRLNDLHARITADIARVESSMLSKFDERDKALLLAAEGLRKEMANLNELRREVTEDRSRLMTKEGDRAQIDQMFDRIEERVSILEKQQVGAAERLSDQKVVTQRVGQLEQVGYLQSGGKLTTGKLFGLVVTVLGIIGTIVVLATVFAGNG